MTEWELKKALGQEIEIPDQVEERIKQACAHAQSTPRKVRRSRRPLRTTLVVAALVAALSISAAAAYVVNHGETFQLFFGNESRLSTEYVEEYDEYGNFYVRSLNEERIAVDEEQAETLVGEYLEDTGYVWQIGEYTLTVESYLLDENTGVGKVSYSLSHPGGLEGITVDKYNQTVHQSLDGIPLPQFCLLRNGTGSFWDGTYVGAVMRTYADLSRSTEDTLYAVDILCDRGWRAADGLRIEISVWQDDTVGSVVIAAMELPAVESLPAITVTDPETGDEVARISSIGMLLRGSDVDALDYVALEYADGTRYVIEDDENDLVNTDYACAFGDRPNVEVRYCFNRLVDTDQVVAVTVDRVTYPVK